MNPQELTRRVLKELAAERATYGYGSIAAIDRRMGKGQGYLGRVLRGEVGLQVETLFEALAALEVDPADFFARVVGTEVHPGMLLRRLERHQGAGDAPPVLERCERLLAGGAVEAAGPEPEPAADELGSELDRIDELRFSRPAAAREPAEAAVEAAARRVARRGGPEQADEGSVKLLARALGVLAAVYRVEARFALAARCLRLVLELSAGRGLPEIRAEYLQRACYLLGDQGEHRLAAEVARQAGDLYVLLRDLPGIGRALVDRAIMLGHLEEIQGAIDAFLGSLEYLPEEPWTSRYSAYAGLGWIYLGRGEVEEAQRWADEAAAAHRTREGQNWWRLVWLEGEIALLRGDLEAAREALCEARSGFDQAGNPFDLALVSLRLAKILLRAGERREVRRIAADMLRLLKPLGKHRIARAAIQELARAALAGEMSGELIDEVFQQVQEGRPRRGAPVPVA